MSKLSYLSVCSGIEAATVAWHRLGWLPVAFSEIDSFPAAVLAHHYPETPNWGDMTKFKEWPDANVDVLIGGTPCQSYSVAGLRAGLDDPRGNLMLTYVAVARKYRPRWLVWENVPGVLSSNKGRDFGSFLGLLTGQRIDVPPTGWQNSGVIPGYKSAYGVAWRVLDAQFAGVPQRRCRVFVVGYLGDWRRAAAVLLERHSLLGHPPPSRKAGPTVAALTANGVGTCGADDNQAQAGHLIGYANAGHFGVMKEVALSDPLRAKGGDTGNGGETLICMSTGQASAGIGIGTTLNCNHEAPILAHTLRGEGFDASEDGTGRGTPLVAVPLQEVGKRTGTSTNDPRAGIGIGADGDPMYTLQSGAQHGVAVAFVQNTRDEVRLMGGDGQIVGTLAAKPGVKQQIYLAFQPGNIKRGCGAAPNTETFPTLSANHGRGASDQDPHILAFNLRGREGGAMAEMASLRASSGGSSRSYVAASAVRRLTPRECERLQEFPDDYTLIPNWQKIKTVRPEKLDQDYLKYLARGGVLTYEECVRAATDGPRYKALGNSMHTGCIRWLGERIEMVEALPPL